MSDDSLDRPLLVFDGECPFCRAWVDYWKYLTGDRALFAPYQEVASRFPDISRAEFASGVKLILPGDQVRSGAHAVFSLFDLVPGKKWMLWCYGHVPLFAPASEGAYGIFARHRSLFFRITGLLWGVPIRPSTYAVSSWLFLRLIGAIYLIAFTSFGVQAAGLIGSRGILPVTDYLAAVREYFGTARFWNAPTVFWISASDPAIRVVWGAGIALSILLLFGLNLRVIRIGVFVLYLSLVTAGQVFMGYQWDALLLEAGFLAFFLGSWPVTPRLFRWLLCRLMLLSGLVKVASGDPNWRHFTALPVHYETQPLPTPLAWYVYQLPEWFHRLSMGFLFFVELVVPFLILAPRRVRLFAAGSIALLQLLIFLTGNYAFFNILAAALCLFLLDDNFFRRSGELLHRFTRAFQQRPRTRLREASYAALAAFVLFVSGFEMVEMFSEISWAPADALIRAVAPFEIINTYGLFANMTTTRPEIIVEGSNDGVTWLAYEFKYKPGDLDRRPTWAEPHQPRLDWQMWFAALGNYRTDRWVLYFMGRLLEGSPDVLGLLRKNPFPEAPPRYVRALVYEYHFTTWQERKVSGEWWRRELKGVYVEPLALRTSN